MQHSNGLGVIQVPYFIKQIWSHRGFIFGSVKREFQTKYLNSLLGVLWSILQPLAMILVYTLIFSRIMQAKLPGADEVFGYSIYLCAGILTWGLFTEIVSRCQNTFIENASLIKKLNFPRICLPVIVLLSACLNFFIIFSLFSLFLVVSGNFPGWSYVLFFPVLVILVGFAVGLGITLGVLNVFFRDVGQLFNIVLQFWFWLTPIVYPVSILPESLRPYLYLNPLAGLMDAFQTILVNGAVPSFYGLILPAVMALLLCVVGLSLYKKHSGDMVDEL
jgi:lipopolysaccharide transport system permease protein